MLARRSESEMDERHESAPALHDQSGLSSDDATKELPALRFHPHSVESVSRPEGYREFRCIPATWSYSGSQPFRELITEYYSQRMDVDPHGVGIDGGFWSGSDAAIRLRDTPSSELNLRELA